MSRIQTLNCYMKVVALFFGLQGCLLAVEGSVLPPLRSKRAVSSNSICLWKHPRSAIIRDTLYVDGGWLYSINSTESVPTTPLTSEGQVYTINFTRPFTTAEDASGIFQIENATTGASNNLFPVYYDGTMFTNNNEYYLYGGLVRPTAAFQPPDADEVTGFEQYQYGPTLQAWAPGFIEGRLPTGVTRYVTHGAGVSVPSENLGFYFSGLRGAGWGEITVPSSKLSTNATVIAESLISVNMTVMRGEVWSNNTLPDQGAPGRVSGEAVWIPTSQSGALVIIGGVADAESAFADGLDSAQISDSQNKSVGFMKTVSVYDVAGQKWYLQDTSGDTPPQLAEACTVVSSANDSSSHSIYLYGGYDALSDTSQPSDAVYILSIPSFTWIKASNGTPSHGRNGHKCARVYPDQMLVIGGSGPTTDTTTCLDGGAVQIFNLNTLTWQSSYDPSKWSEYKVPSVVTAQIGGSADGGATLTAPTAWATSDLSTLFGTKYSKTITNYYPYASVGSQPTRIPTAVPSSNKSSLPKWVAPVLGVVLGSVVLSIAICCLFFWRRRKDLRQRGTSEAGGSANPENRITSWMRRIPSSGTKPPPSSTNETEPSDGIMTPGGTVISSAQTEKGPISSVEPLEMGGTPVHELPDTSRPSELANTPPMSQVQSTSPHSRSSVQASAEIPRPESPTTGSGRSLVADPRLSLPAHSHSHSRSISSDLVPVAPGSESEKLDSITSPVSPVGSSMANSQSGAVGRQSSRGGSGGGKPPMRVSNFDEMME